MAVETSQQEKILDAAYHCIAKQGYAHVTLRQIAKEAGVAVSQISYHYQNKEGLLLAVVTRAANKYQEYLQDYLKPDMTPKEKGDTLIRLYQQLLEEDVELFRVLYDLVGLSLWSEPFRLEVKEVFEGITEQITTEVFTDELMGELGYVYSSKTLASVFFGGLFGIAIQALLEQENEDIIKSLSALVVIFNK
ncbi:MAG: TetR/AcrR family transcriptional regulator [Limnochordia bacterium]|jgi:AcrR family transcriptional regulator